LSARRPGVPYHAISDCKCCAERKLIKGLTLEARRQGIHPTCFAAWIHRKYGDLVVIRVKSDGVLGVSLPCVLCRKALDRLSIQWRAHTGTEWIKSTDPAVPAARPTQKQKVKLGFK
jgi:hypothetical protein